MKALILKDVENISVEEVEKPSAGSKEVLVKVGACGVCGSDIPRAYRDGAHNMPLIVGHEFAGTVEAVGPDVDNSWIGKSVGVFPLIPCMKCSCCKNKKFEMCKDYSYLGSRRDGGFAEYAVVPEWNVIELPNTVTLDQAAMMEPMAVAVHAIRQGFGLTESGDKESPLKTHASWLKDKTVAVMGLGAIGLLVTMFLKDLGIKTVYAIGNKEYQKQKVSELGIPADCYCDGYKEDEIQWLQDKTDGEGVDVFFECIGKAESYNVAAGSVTPGGRVCLIGNPYGDMNLDRQIYWKILRNQVTLVGTWNSSFTHEPSDDWHYVLDRLHEGAIHPESLITQRYDLEHIMDGYELMRDKKEPYVKVMME
ncbi:MAG: galactitol-1-phosphate 5-dehydrogenase [Pseudobutyrivibrio sp.]|nr:galactitol-1-phosphate 5-dehydrogenase [Pseudobutyrivibrio sp.]